MVDFHQGDTKRIIYHSGKAVDTVNLMSSKHGYGWGVY